MFYISVHVSVTLLLMSFYRFIPLKLHYLFNTSFLNMSLIISQVNLYLYQCQNLKVFIDKEKVRINYYNKHNVNNMDAPYQYVVII